MNKFSEHLRKSEKPSQDAGVMLVEPDFDNPNRVYKELADEKNPDGRKLTCRERKLAKRMEFTTNWKWVVKHPVKPAPKKLTFKQARAVQQAKKKRKNQPAEARPPVPIPEGMTAKQVKNRARRGKFGPVKEVVATAP